jgi:transcriptional regulator with XRE-family HTH domain
MKTLKKARTERGFSQKQLALRVGITDITISNIENGRTKPTKASMLLIEQTLGAIDWQKTYANGKLNSN